MVEYSFADRILVSSELHVTLTPQCIEIARCIFLFQSEGTVARMDGREDARSQADVGVRARKASRPETLGAYMDSSKEKTSILGELRVLDNGVTRRRRRSRFGGGRPESKTELGVSSVMTAVAVLGVLIISLLAIRFVACSRTLMSQGATRGRMLSGTTSRKLAHGQDGVELTPLSKGGGEPGTEGLSQALKRCSGDVEELFLVFVPETPTAEDRRVSRWKLSAGELALYFLPFVLILVAVVCLLLHAYAFEKDQTAQLGLEVAAYVSTGLGVLVAVVTLGLESWRLLASLRGKSEREQRMQRSKEGETRGVREPRAGHP